MMLYRTATLLASVVLTGCASFSADGGFSAVQQLTQERVGHAPAYQRTAAASDAVQTRLHELLKIPLTADSATEIALLNNRGLQARLAGLGIAEADRVRAGRPANPRFGFGRLSGQGSVEIDRKITFDVLGWLLWPWASQFEAEQFTQTQWELASDAVGLAAQAQRNYFEAVAAQQLVGYYQQVLEAADASRELAQRMVAAGNFTALEQMREQSFHTDATAQLARANYQAIASRERLIRVLGLSGEQLGLQLPKHLPDLPEAPIPVQDAEQTAIEQRLDVQIAQRATQATARSLGLTRTTRFINVLHLGYQNKSETGSPHHNGYEIELELPLFDFGATRMARAEAIYMQSLHQTAEVAINAQSEVREAHAAYRSAYDLARHYRDKALPLRKHMSEEKLLHYNGMFLSVFELLADARDHMQTVTAAIQAQRDYWIAQTQLQTALTGRSPGPLALGASAASTTTSASPAAGH